MVLIFFRRTLNNLERETPQNKEDICSGNKNASKTTTKLKRTKKINQGTTNNEQKKIKKKKIIKKNT